MALEIPPHQSQNGLMYTSPGAPGGCASDARPWSQGGLIIQHSEENSSQRPRPEKQT